MNRRAKQAGLPLPWEGRTAWVSGALRGPRWRIVLGGLLIASLALLLIRTASRHQTLSTTRGRIVETRRAVQRFRAQIGRCPNSVTELVHPPRSGLRYLRETPKDAWNNPLYIECPGHNDPDSADVVSAGPSGDFFVDDNIY